MALFPLCCRSTLRRGKQILIPGIFLILAGCSSTIHTAYDHRVDFLKYKTFCWVQGCEFNYSGPKYLDDSLVRKHFKTAIIETLLSKGIKYDADYPELMVDVNVTIEKKSDLVFHRDPDIQYSFLPLAEPQLIEYLNGTLVIDMLDRKEGRMVWRSVANGYMSLHPELTEKNIKNGINRVLRDFPPKAKLTTTP